MWLPATIGSGGNAGTYARPDGGATLRAPRPRTPPKRGPPGDRRGGAERPLARAQCSTLRGLGTDGVNHGKKSSKFNRDCTICRSCRWSSADSSVLELPECGFEWRESRSHRIQSCRTGGHRGFADVSVPRRFRGSRMAARHEGATSPGWKASAAATPDASRHRAEQSDVAFSAALDIEVLAVAARQGLRLRERKLGARPPVSRTQRRLARAARPHAGPRSAWRTQVAERGRFERQRYGALPGRREGCGVGVACTAPKPTEASRIANRVLPIPGASCSFMALACPLHAGPTANQRGGSRGLRSMNTRGSPSTTSRPSSSPTVSAAARRPHGQGSAFDKSTV